MFGFAKGTDLADAFAIGLPSEASQDVVTLAKAVFEHQPRWVLALMSARDAIVGRVGLKTSRELRTGGNGNGHERVGIFRVYERRERELILGEDDRHLDFRASLLVRAGKDGNDEVVVSTVVHCHNRLGRVYLAAIRPFHRLIVPAYLRNAARRGWPARSV